MSILVTVHYRKEKRWSAVCGPWDAWPRSFPLIAFYARQGASALGDALARWGPDDTFALSQHAVEFAHARLQQQGLLPPTSALFAIGRTTALALHTVSGQHIHYPLDREI